MKNAKHLSKFSGIKIAAIFHIFLLVLFAWNARADQKCAEGVDNVAEVRAKVSLSASKFEGIRLKIVEREANGVTMLGVFYDGWPVSPVYIFMNRREL